ncbi:MAG: nicotinamide-nucleotide amidohydrolase family protein [Candidatus Dormiibacterota bacterium]
MNLTARAAKERVDADRPPRQPVRLDLDDLSRLKTHEYLVRFAFGFAISVVAGLAAELFGGRVGGLFLAFPAILPATLTLLEKQNGTAQAVSDIRAAAIGGAALLAFAAVVAAAVRHSPALALVGALGSWVVASALIFLGLRTLVRMLGERQYLPEIPTEEAAPVVAALMQRGLTLATAESCTGGTVAALLTAVPGAGKVLRGGVVACDQELKRDLLGVPEAMLESEGTISAEVAKAMAHGARVRLGADVGVGVTCQLAGFVERRPPGLTYIAVEGPDGHAQVEKFSRDNGSGRNRERAVRMALELTRRLVESSGHNPVS